MTTTCYNLFSSLNPNMEMWDRMEILVQVKINIIKQ